MEFDDPRDLAEWLDAGRPLDGVRLQDLDLTSVAARLLDRASLRGLVVLGGRVPPAVLAPLLDRGAVVFPSDDSAPVDVFRARLYTAAELYDGLCRPGGYADTPDARAYRWSRDAREADDAYATLLRAMHDDSVSDALSEWVGGWPVVGVMGGHRSERGSRGYGEAARLGAALASRGLLVATGGGPGAMEAVNLGATAPGPDALGEAIARLAAVPSYQPDITAWARLAMEVLAGFGPAAGSARSMGIPTWFYGHEPPNVFPQAIAKYFSNAVREDGLVARSSGGVVVLPGAAGTVQEVFQVATRLYYPDWPGRAGNTDPLGARLPRLVLVGRRQWVQDLPVWPLLQALARDRPMADALHLVDDIDEAAEVVRPVS